MKLRPAANRTAALALLVALLATAAPPMRAQDAPAAAAATGTVYNIEMIIFRSTGAPGAAEAWGASGASARNIAGDESSSSTSQVGHFVSVLPSSAWQLADLENKLRASGAYVPVAHVAWSQTASSWGTRAGFPLSRLGVSVGGPAGRSSARRFLHLGMSARCAMAMAAYPAPASTVPRCATTSATTDHPASRSSRW